MAVGWEHVRNLLRGSLPEGTPWPLTLRVVLCDLRPRFLPKGRAGRGCRAISRNGRLLLCSEVPLADLAGLPAQVRLQTWHKAILPGDVPEPYGLLLCVRPADEGSGPLGKCCLASSRDAVGEVLLEVGGGMTLAFLP